MNNILMILCSTWSSIADRVPVVMRRGVAGLEKFSFAVGKEIISRSEYLFDLYHQVRDSSNSIHFVFSGKYSNLLSFFRIHIHFELLWLNLVSDSFQAKSKLRKDCNWYNNYQQCLERNTESNTHVEITCKILVYTDFRKQP